uniref:CASP-like protein n=1 Tax=Solanum lycopersicum TaxID=4081 RepID=A0A3Q7H740_SOLLC
MDIVRVEFLLRLLAILLLVLTACLVGFDSQTKVVFLTVQIKANFKYLGALSVLVWIDAAAAIYNVLQLLRCFFIATSKVVVYIVFAANSAAIEASAIALIGIKSLQWMKICNRFTRFCIQIGAALILGYIAVLILFLVSSISAFQLFRLYSPKHFLKLKTKLIDDSYVVHQNVLQNDLQNN